MLEIDEVKITDRKPTDEWMRRMPDMYIGLSPEKWAWQALGYPPEPGYGLDGYPLQLECNAKLRGE